MAENIVPDTNINIPDKVLQVMNGSLLETGDITMLKVPPLLRQDKSNQQEYEPLVVSIGPYHHGKKKLQSTERFKTASFMKLVREREKWVGGQSDAKLFYEKVLDVVNDLRNCYMDVSKNQYDDPYFAQMMLLDACFLIEYFFARSSLSLMEDGGLNELSFAYILRDLLLLENQIPFWLIKMLIVLAYGEEEGKEFVQQVLIDGQHEPIHYLHAVWSHYSLHLSDQIITPPDQPSKLGELSQNCINLLKNVTRFPCQWRKRGDEEDQPSKLGKLSKNRINLLKTVTRLRDDSIYSFSSASELKARGIYFRPSASRKKSLTSFKFNQGKLFSTLEVPVCHVTKYTKSLFLNMIAYELSGSRSTNYHRNVTAYIEFMKLLIDNTKDVKELREKEILKVTNLGSDEDVLKVFKELNTYGLDLDQVRKLNFVKKNIQAHYNNKVKNWIGELLYTYFRSPWAAIALHAAIFLLILTFLQTYYTVNPWNG